MKKKDKYATVSTYIGVNASIEGIIDFRDAIRLDGNLKGKIISSAGTVIIGEKAIIHADIEVDVAIVQGEVNGFLKARDRIEISPPARINGDIQAPVVSIKTGVVFNGTCSMKENNILVDSPACSVDAEDDKSAQTAKKL